MYAKRISLSERPLEKIRLEIDLQRRAGKYGFTPIIHDVIETEEDISIIMDNLEAPCIADKYAVRKIPKRIWKEIHKIVRTLYQKENIEYVDITGYNFIEKERKIYIIDFGDAFLHQKEEPINWFLDQFLKGDVGWNPDFA